MRRHSTGLLEHDTIVSVRGPVNMSLQWIVSWRSGRMSVLTNAQCRAEASSALLDWYEGNLVIDQGAAPKKRSTTPTELVG
jgi:predicted lipid carrier protein YhbT